LVHIIDITKTQVKLTFRFAGRDNKIPPVPGITIITGKSLIFPAIRYMNIGPGIFIKVGICPFQIISDFKFPGAR
ncbi:MAG: hypothetical protein P8Y06_01510, partial [Patescibacteria group bacterium]